MRKHDTAPRRRFLGLAGAAAAASAATAASAVTLDGSRAGLPAQAETEAEKRKPRYRETDHVRAFYRTNRG